MAPEGVMEIPEHLRDLVDRLGQALVQALATDPASRALAREIQAEGFEVTLMLEATVALHKRDSAEEGEAGPEEEESETEEETRPLPEARRPEPERGPSPWSEEDRAFLRTFKISLD